MNLAGAATSDRITANGTVAVGGALQLNLVTGVAPGTAITLTRHRLRADRRGRGCHSDTMQRVILVF